LHLHSLSAPPAKRPLPQFWDALIFLVGRLDYNQRGILHWRRAKRAHHKRLVPAVGTRLLTSLALMLIREGLARPDEYLLDVKEYLLDVKIVRNLQGFLEWPSSMVAPRKGRRSSWLQLQHTRA
jgi:hypothetical protein